MAIVDSGEFRAALRARDRAAASFLFNPRVSLIDVGWKIKEGEGNRVTPTLAVRVHLRHKPRGIAAESFAAHNPELYIPENAIGFPEVDFIQADYRLQWDGYSFWRAAPRASIYNPLRGGISISNEWNYGYGTLGGIVRDRGVGNRKMILSAWHVLASSSYSRSGLKIYQPGYGDGGQPQHTVARLTRHAMSEGIDAAVAELIDDRRLVNDQLDVGPVAGVTDPVLGMRVIKSGRASGVTEGLVSGVEGELPIRYAGFQRKVRHIAHIAPVSGGKEVSRGGDSGSWWLEKNTRRAVALHIAGDDEPEYALAIAMPRVLDALNVDIIL